MVERRCGRTLAPGNVIAEEHRLKGRSPMAASATSWSYLPKAGDRRFLIVSVVRFHSHSIVSDERHTADPVGIFRSRGFEYRQLYREESCRSRGPGNGPLHRRWQRKKFCQCIRQTAVVSLRSDGDPDKVGHSSAGEMSNEHSTLTQRLSQGWPVWLG
jgi:hypothetical protein